MVIASFKPASGSTATSTTYIHSDHLGSTNATTDATGYTTKVLDYYPYGNERISSGSDTQQRTYIGQYSDPESNLSYLNARYYDGARGGFLSQDPVHLAVGNPNYLQSLTGKSQDYYLTDPQLLNSYNYGRLNPITNKDPNGTCPACPILIAAGVGAIGGVGIQAFNDFVAGEYSGLSSYATAATNGAVVGVGVAVAAILAPAGLAGTAVIGVTSGTLTAGTTYVGDLVLGKDTDLTNLAINSGISAITAGFLKTLPQVRGRLPNFNTQAMYAGKHTIRQGAEELFSSSAQIFGVATGGTVRSASGSYSGSTSANAGSVTSQLKSIVSSLQGIVRTLSGMVRK